MSSYLRLTFTGVDFRVDFSKNPRIHLKCLDHKTISSKFQELLYTLEKNMNYDY